MAALVALALLCVLHFTLGETFPRSEFNCTSIIESDASTYLSRQFGNLSQVYENLVNCPNTTSLRLKHYDLASRYSETKRTDPSNFKFLDGDRFPEIRELSLEGYDFGDYRFFHHLREAPGHDWAKGPMKPMLLEEAGGNYLPLSQAVYMPGANIDAWKKVMDWTQLRSLKLSRTDNIFFWKMRGHLPALTDLTIRDNDGRSNVSEYMTDFLTALNPLSNLTAHGYTDLVDWSRVLERHGNNLENLAITEWNALDSQNDTQTLSTAQLEDISHQCPRLRSLSVNVKVGTEISDESLNALASFTNVTKLHLWLPANKRKRYDPATDYVFEYPYDFVPSAEELDSGLPFMTPQKILRIFHELRSKKKGVELQQLEAYVGDCEIQYGLNRPIPDWNSEYVSLMSRHVCNVFNKEGERKGEGEAWCDCEGLCQERPYG